MRLKRFVCLMAVLSMLLSVLPADAVAVGPTLASGAHVNWIDRIANLPDYARNFYAWLENNSDVNGVLADPTKGSRMGTDYVHKIHEIKGTLNIDPGSDSDQIQAAIMDVVRNDAQAVVDFAFEVYGAFDRDHPEVFWLNTESLCGQSLSYSVSSQTGAVSYDLDIVFYLRKADFDIRLECYRDPAVLAAAVAQRDADIQRILRDCPDGSVAEKVRYLNRSLTESNAYNFAVGTGKPDAAADTAWKCVSALSGKSGTEGPVCEGYARAFKVLCDKLGIPCVLTEGYARTSLTEQNELHMWNYVKIDGNWYAVDVTWNDPFVSSSVTVKSGQERETYLLIGTNSVVSSSLTFGGSHKVRNGLNSGGQQYTNGPVLSSDAYSFRTEEPVPTEPKPTEPQPAEHAVPENYMNIASYRSSDGYTAPQKDGFVFAGWYQDQELTVPLDLDTTTGFAYASFVDAQLLSVKCQLPDDASAELDSVDLRLLTGIPTLRLHHVTFGINGDTEKIGTGVYEWLEASNGQPSAADIFGPDAAYIMTVVLPDIPRGQFGDQIVITPGWYTLDGTYVAGTPRTVRISEGFNT